MTDDFVPSEMAGLADFLPGLAKLVERAGVGAEINKITESPIETAFGLEAALIFSKRYAGHPRLKFQRCRPDEEHNYSRNHILMMPQYCWRNFRTDWAFKATNLRSPYFFVECDGKDFHTSPEQVRKDRLRDNEMMLGGVTVLRFTGSQIHRDVIAAIQTQYTSEWNRGLHREAA
jgi:hypothetical protein